MLKLIKNFDVFLEKLKIEKENGFYYVNDIGEFALENRNRYKVSLHDIIEFVVD